MMSIMRARMNARRLPVALRAVVGLAMVVGLLTMCHVAFSSAASVEPDISTTSASGQTIDDRGASASNAPSTDDSDVEGISGDCALLITCAVALLALGALLLLRSARADRVLWQRAVPLCRVDGIPSRRPNVSAFVREPAALVC